jgi:hypothetical protein
MRAAAPGFLGHDAEPIAHVRGRLRMREQEMRLSQDRRQRIVDLVRDAGSELADRLSSSPRGSAGRARA